MPSRPKVVTSSLSNMSQFIDQRNIRALREDMKAQIHGRPPVPSKTLKSLPQRQNLLCAD